MRLKSLVTLIGVALIGATAAQAATTAKADAAQTDWTTTLNVKLALLNKLGTDTLHIDVVSVGGTVNLKGTVDQQKTKELAAKVAMATRGVRRVENGIRLEAVANSSHAGAADAEVKDAVLDTRLRLALIDEMGSDGFNIDTDAADGVVTLSFDSAFANDGRERAVAIATGLKGVSKVVSVDKT